VNCVSFFITNGLRPLKTRAVVSNPAVSMNIFTSRFYIFRPFAMQSRTSKQNNAWAKVQGQIWLREIKFIVTCLMPAVKDALQSAVIFRNSAFWHRLYLYVSYIFLEINSNYFPKLP
jgi:hypothetical protein